MADSTEQIIEDSPEKMDWKEVENNLRKTQDLWWLNEIDVDGKKRLLRKQRRNGRSLRMMNIWKMTIYFKECRYPLERPFR